MNPAEAGSKISLPPASPGFLFGLLFDLEAGGRSGQLPPSYMAKHYRRFN
jgi:hypothetical protein